jgi:hypothetical protein
MIFDRATELIKQPLVETITTLRQIRRGVIDSNDPSFQQSLLLDAVSLARIASLALTQSDFSDQNVFFQAWKRVVDRQSSVYRQFEPYAYYTEPTSPQLHRLHLPVINLIRKSVSQHPTGDGKLYNLLYYDPRWLSGKSGVFAPLSIDYLFYCIQQQQMLLDTGEVFDLAPVADANGKVVTLKTNDMKPLFQNRDSIGIAFYNIGSGATYRTLYRKLSQEYPSKPIYPRLSFDII